MFLKRKIYIDLLDWKNSRQGSSALLIEGARRVGKSFIALEFGKNEYNSCILVDFSEPIEGIISLFTNPITNMDLFFQTLSFIFHTELYERNSLIILDEVQKCPEAREKIKAFVRYGKYDFIETGSLISIKENVKDILIPSEETHIQMYPLDFEEYLYALDEEKIIGVIKEHFKTFSPLDNPTHIKLSRIFREYMLVGGMPRAVIEYLNTKDFLKVDLIKRDILSLYRSDTSQHSGNLKNTVTTIFDLLVPQLSKHEKKFKFSSLSKSSRYRKYEDAIFWLEDSMVTSCCFNTTEPNYGLKMSVKHSSLKLYMGDTGLLVTMAFSGSKPIENEIYKNILLDKLQINEGMITENVVAQMLKTLGYNLYFFSSKLYKTDKRNTEIDFLIQKNNKISPIEVKSSSSKRHISVDKFSIKFKSKIGQIYIINKNNLSVSGSYVYLPFYMVFCL
jgi:predicted AAA+ superfamily ATPase